MSNIIEILSNYGVDRSGYEYKKINGQWQRGNFAKDKLRVWQKIMINAVKKGNKELVNHMIITYVNAYNRMHGIINENENMSLKEAKQYILRDYKKVDQAYSIGEFDYSYEEIDSLAKRINDLLIVSSLIYAFENENIYIDYSDENIMRSIVNS